MLTHLIQVSDQTIEPITSEDFKQFKRVDLSYDDQLIDLCIRSARFVSENYTGRAFITRQFKAYYEAFPSESTVILPRSPLVSLDAVKYIDSAGSLTVIDSADYFYSTKEPIRLQAVNSWPTPKEKVFDPVEVTFTAGYGAEDRFVPEEIKIALLFFASYLYDNRDPEGAAAIPASVLSALRVIKVR